MFVFLMQVIGFLLIVLSVCGSLLLLFLDSDFVLFRKTLKKEYFRDRVVWITGASSGIGEALAQRLSKLGARIILSARSGDKLREVQQGLENPGNARVLVMDVSDTSTAEHFVSSAVQLFGHVDMLINNAGISQRGLNSDFSLEVERKIMDVNFFGPIAITKALLPYLKKQGGGHICNISSVAGKTGYATRTAYGASKAALISYMDALRMELQGLRADVAVTNVCPGPVKTSVDVNSLRGDGTVHGKEDTMISFGMKAERCALLTLKSMSSRLPEVWISRHPQLFFTYLNQYLPYVFFKVSPFLAKVVVSRVKKMAASTPEAEKKVQ